MTLNTNFINISLEMRNMKITLLMKLRPLTRRKEKMLVEAIDEFKACVNEWLKAIDELGEKPNRRNLHNFAYQRIREMFNLHSNVIQDAMNLAIEIWRSWNKNEGDKPVFDSDCIYFKGVDVKIENDGLIVPLKPRERVYLPLYVRKYHRRCLQYKHGRVIITKRGNEFYACISVNIPEKEPFEPQGFLGVDFGYYNIIVVADDKGREIMRVQGDELIQRKEYYEKLRARRQQRLMKVFGVKDKSLGNRDRNYVNDLNHKIAKELVLTAKRMRKVIVIERLKGLKRNGSNKNKKIRKILHRWSYHDLIQKIKYKAKLEGVLVMEGSPRNTSKNCSKCGYVYKRFKNQRLFHCPNCGSVIDRDLNASINIARKGMEEFNKRAFLLALKSEVSSSQGG